MPDDNPRHVTVANWYDIDGAPDVTARDKQRVATIFSEQDWDHVVWLPTWLLEDEDKEIETVEASDHLAVGDVSDYSEKAWAMTQPHLNRAQWAQYLPKSSVVVFERVPGIGVVETPQQGLTAFAGDGDA